MKIYKPRIIARLDIKGPNVVKGVHFEGLRVLGEPNVLAMQYYEQGADELLYIDTVASLYGRNNLTEVVKKAASNIFIPMTVGGGIRSVEDALELFRCGADKIAVNTHSVKRPNLLKELVMFFGSQAVVASLEIKRQTNGFWEIYIDNGRERTGIDAFEWIKKVQDFGVGEILITSIDQDGTGKGFDEEFVGEIHSLVSVPLVLGGGGKVVKDIVRMANKKQVDAFSFASGLHYGWFTIQEIKYGLQSAKIAVASH